LMGFWQELNAGKAADKLKKFTRISHRVMRDGKLTVLASEHIVPGDLLVLKAGDILPADCRILESRELHVNESVLTGESFPAEKNAGVLVPPTALAARSNCLWKGTSVISGTAYAVAVFTGKDTEFGKLLSSINEQPETAFEKGIKGFGFFMLQITIVLTLTCISEDRCSKLSCSHWLLRLVWRRSFCPLS
jgi:P-type Mg2+ transporter